MSLTGLLDLGKMDELGRMDTPAHRIDARAKVLVTSVFICVVMSFPRHEISSLAPFLLYPVALTSLGRIPLRYIGRKMIIAAPFALIIGIFNPIVDRQPVAAIGPFVITSGWVSFASIMLRFVLTVGAADRRRSIVAAGLHGDEPPGRRDAAARRSARVRSPDTLPLPIPLCHLRPCRQDEAKRRYALRRTPPALSSIRLDDRPSLASRDGQG